MEKFRSVLDKIRRNRYKDDLHSVMVYFKSGTVAFIEARLDKSFWVVVRDKGVSIDCSTIEEVIDYFSNEEVSRYET